MKKTKDALKKQEAEMLKQFNVEQLEERLEMKKWGSKGTTSSATGWSVDEEGRHTYD